jgi:hypothetical protein
MEGGLRKESLREYLDIGEITERLEDIMYAEYGTV